MATKDLFENAIENRVKQAVEELKFNYIVFTIDKADLPKDHVRIAKRIAGFENLTDAKDYACFASKKWSEFNWVIKKHLKDITAIYHQGETIEHVIEIRGFKKEFKEPKY